MIDWNATLKLFFQEVIDNLNKHKAKAKDEVEANKIVGAIAAIRAVAQNPQRYAEYGVRIRDGVEADVMAFPQGGVYHIFQTVQWKMGKLNSQFDWERKDAQQVLLDGLKKMKYINATSLLKDLYFPFVSPEKYAIKKSDKVH